MIFKMRKKLLMLPCIAAVAIATFVGTKTMKSNALESNDLLLANIEALTLPENYSKVQERQTSQCTISVGANAKIKLLGGTILKADASGEIKFDGQVICIGTGEVQCKPVECVDLYQAIL
jgi:hypothetical protein